MFPDSVTKRFRNFDLYFFFYDTRPEGINHESFQTLTVWILPSRMVALHQTPK